MSAAAPDRELLPTATGAQMRAALGALLRTRRGLAVAAFGVLAAATAVGLAAAPLLGHIVDLVATGHPPTSITTPVLLLAAIAAVQGVATAYGLFLIARLGEGMLADLRERFMNRALHLPLDRLERAGSGDLTSRVTNDVTVVANAMRSALPELTRATLTIALTLVALAVLDWRFLLAALLAAPVQLHTVRWYAGRALPLYATQRTAEAPARRTTVHGAPVRPAARRAGTASRTASATRVSAIVSVTESLGSAERIALATTVTSLVTGRSVLRSRPFQPVERQVQGAVHEAFRRSASMPSPTWRSGTPYAVATPCTAAMAASSSTVLVIDVGGCPVAGPGRRCGRGAAARPTAVAAASTPNAATASPRRVRSNAPSAAHSVRPVAVRSNSRPCGRAHHVLLPRMYRSHRCVPGPAQARTMSR